MRFVAQDAAPLWIQILSVIIIPPVMALLFAVMARGWAATVFGILGKGISETTKKEQAWEFWLVLWGCYAVGIGMLIYAHVFR